MGALLRLDSSGKFKMFLITGISHEIIHRKFSSVRSSLNGDESKRIGAKRKNAGIGTAFRVYEQNAWQIGRNAQHKTWRKTTLCRIVKTLNTSRSGHFPSVCKSPGEFKRKPKGVF